MSAETSTSNLAKWRELSGLTVEADKSLQGNDRRAAIRKLAAGAKTDPFASGCRSPRHLLKPPSQTNSSRGIRVTEPIQILPVAAPVPGDAVTHVEPKGYWNLVAGQFRKNRVAVASVCMIALLFLVAAWAPVIANGKPFVWTRGGKTTYPLTASFVAPEYNIDLIFNILCLATLTLPICFGARLLLQKVLPHWRPKKWIFLTAGLILAILPFLNTNFSKHVIFRDSFDTRIPYVEDAKDLDPSKGDRAVFTLIGQDPITPTGDLLIPPDRIHWLGTDSQGRDVMARMLHGSRISLSVGFVAEGIALLVGIIMGSLAGFYRGWVDIAISRFIEAVICFPTFFLILIIIAYAEKRSIFLIMVVIGLTGWTGIARLVRGEFLKLAELDYVQSARALGASSLRVMFRHILPNAMGPVLVAGAFGVAGAILIESGLSYLGFGAPPPTPTWGEMISQGNANLDAAWWMIVFPGLSIFLTVTVYNLAGDGLRDAMDPKMRH